jgi:hypothetical protein
MAWLLAALSRAVSRARWRRQHQIVSWDLRPVGLLQVLALVLNVGVVQLVIIDCNQPVVCGPYDTHAGSFRAFGESAEAGEEVRGRHDRMRTTQVPATPSIRGPAITNGPRTRGDKWDKLGLSQVCPSDFLRVAPERYKLLKGLGNSGGRYWDRSSGPCRVKPVMRLAAYTAVQ